MSHNVYTLTGKWKIGTQAETPHKTGITMKPFIFEQWQAWDKQNPFTDKPIYLSDENNGILREFATVDDTINWLFVNGHKPAARALNRHVKCD